MICSNCKEEIKTGTGIVRDNNFIWLCKNCKNQYKPLQTLKGCDNFTPHYDAQLGTFFESREHKDIFLKSKGLYQISGTDSPRQTEGKGRLVCSKDQYKNGYNRI